MNDSGQAHESLGAMERGFVEPTDLPGVPHTPPSQGSRQSQHSGQGSERGTGRPGNVRNQTGQDNPFQAATGTQGSLVHAAQWQQQQQHPCPGLGPCVMPQGPAWFGAQWMPRGPNLSSGVPNLAAVPPFPGQVAVDASLAVRDLELQWEVAFVVQA